MTPHTGFRTITIKFHAFHALAELTGRFLFVFNGEALWFPVGETLFTAAQCEAAFEELRNIDDVSCTMSTSGDNSVTYTVQLRKFPVLPVETSIYTNDGNPSLTSFVCNTDQVVMYSEENQIFCDIGELHTDKVYPGERAFLLWMVSLFFARYFIKSHYVYLFLYRICPVFQPWHL